MLHTGQEWSLPNSMGTGGGTRGPYYEIHIFISWVIIDPLHLTGSTLIPAPDPDLDPDPHRFLFSHPDPLKKALMWIKTNQNYVE